jgi:hypothetical protein
LRQQAYCNAIKAAPLAATVADLARLERLLNREQVDTAETAAANQGVVMSRDHGQDARATSRQNRCNACKDVRRKGSILL